MSSLIASNRNANLRKKDTYFRHKSDSNCQGETLIHLWGKQVIADKKIVLGAKYKAIGKAKDLARKYHFVELLQPPEYLDLTNIELEERVIHKTDFKTPDILAQVADSVESIAIEVFVNNAVNDKKALFFAEKSMDCLEIDLSSLPPLLIDSPRDFEQYVINVAPRSWVYCSRYKNLDVKSQKEADKKAKATSEVISARRNTARTIRSQWRDDHSEFIQMVEAYLNPENKKKVITLYEYHLDKEGTLSNGYRIWFDANFGCIPKIINIPLKGELGFNCHRSVWQWEIYKRLVLYSHFKSTQGTKKAVKTKWFSRGYEDSSRLLAWYDYAPKWSPESLYESVKDIIPQNKISIEAELIAGELLVTERDKPDSLAGLKMKEWREIPKPVCTIRRYIKELLKEGVVEVFSGDTYVVPQDVIIPVTYDVSRLKI
jgi:hypothetical protein